MISTLAGRRTLPISAELLAEHALALPGGWDWPVRRAAFEAILRRLSSARAQELTVVKSPRVGPFGDYTLRSRQTGGDLRYAIRLYSVAPLQARCNCPDFPGLLDRGHSRRHRRWRRLQQRESLPGKLRLHRRRWRWRRLRFFVPALTFSSLRLRALPCPPCLLSAAPLVARAPLRAIFRPNRLVGGRYGSGTSRDASPVFPVLRNQRSGASKYGVWFGLARFAARR